MVKPLWVIIGVVVSILTLVSVLSSAEMSGSVQSLQFSIATIAYSGEANEIRMAVNEFMKIRNNPYSEDSKIKAQELDEKLNDLELVKNNCKDKISTIELAVQQNPYRKLQENCPVLEKVSFSKAVYLWSSFR
ncbi:MAG: hypothetical protein OEQ12_04310 [Nitrosopumilus sp.]|nr:hypothetical protein [Nitrosopumilus sp.]